MSGAWNDKRRDQSFTAKARRSAERGNYDGRFTYGGGPAEAYVICAQFRPYLAAMVLRHEVYDPRRNYRQSGNGGIRNLAELAVPFYRRGVKTTAIIRRMHDILYELTNVTSLELADALCVADHTSVIGLGLHVFPTKLASARHMIDIWMEHRNGSFDEKDREDLAKELMAVGRACAHRQDRYVSCTPEAAQIIGGSGYLKPWRVL